jgi:hypothetical protein
MSAPGVLEGMDKQIIDFNTEKSPLEEALERAKVLQEHAEFNRDRTQQLLARKHATKKPRRAQSRMKKANNAVLSIQKINQQVEYLESLIRREAEQKAKAAAEAVAVNTLEVVEEQSS